MSIEYSSPICSLNDSCIALQTPEGKYLYVNEGIKQAARLVESDIYDLNWRDICPPDEVAAEARAIEEALHTDRMVVRSIRRKWEGREFLLRCQISSVKSRIGTKLVLKEAAIVEHWSEDDVAFQLPAGSGEDDDSLEYMANQLEFVQQLAAREELESVRFILSMARIEVRRRQEDIHRARRLGRP